MSMPQPKVTQPKTKTLEEMTDADLEAALRYRSRRARSLRDSLEVDALLDEFNLRREAKIA